MSYIALACMAIRQKEDLNLPLNRTDEQEAIEKKIAELKSEFGSVKALRETLGYKSFYEASVDMLGMGGER